MSVASVVLRVADVFVGATLAVLALAGVAWTLFGLCLLWVFDRAVVDELACSSGTWRLYRSGGVAGQDGSEVTLEPAGGVERLVLGAFRDPDICGFHRNGPPVDVTIRNGWRLRLDHAEAAALHRDDAFLFVYGGEAPERRSNLRQAVRMAVIRWGGLLLLLPFGVWSWLERRAQRRNAALEPRSAAS
jgi:hypothetical protein